MAHIVVVGAGQAGASLVAKLRVLGFDGAITLIGEESVPPYQRPPLSKKYLTGEMAEERLYLRPKSFYAENDIKLRLGQQVTQIDTASQAVKVGDDVLNYDELALTTGSAPRSLPAVIGGDLEGVYTVRSLADVDAMAPEFRDGARVLIIGGGYIGLEAAAVAASRGLQVTLIEMAPRILGRVASAETSDYFRALHTSHGVKILEGTGLEKLTGEERVTGALLSNGTQVKTDFVIVGVGIAPVVAQAEAAGIRCENGIKADDMGRTSAPHVWTAGDCAVFPYNGAMTRLESVQNAIDQAEAVAANMLGAQTPYQPFPWFWSDQYDISLQIAGLNTGYDEVVVRLGNHPSQSHWYYQNGRFLAVDAMNDPRAYMVGKRLLEAGKTPDPAIVADPSSDLKALLKA